MQILKCNPDDLADALLAKRRALQASRGMTLIEILVVLAIIGMIVGGVSVAAFGRFEASKIKNTKTAVKNIQSQVEIYKLEKSGKCPKTMQDLKASGITKGSIKDPWNNEFKIICPGEKDMIDVMSFGPDGQEGTDDDITTWADPDADSKDNS